MPRLSLVICQPQARSREKSEIGLHVAACDADGVILLMPLSHYRRRFSPPVLSQKTQTAGGRRRALIRLGQQAVAILCEGEQCWRKQLSGDGSQVPQADAADTQQTRRRQQVPHLPT